MVLYEQAGKILTKSDDPRYKLLFATQNLEVFDNKQTKNKKQKTNKNKTWYHVNHFELKRLRQFERDFCKLNNEMRVNYE